MPSGSTHASPLHAAAIGCLLLNAFIWGVSWWPFRQLNALGLHSLWATGFAFGLNTLLISLWRPSAWRALFDNPQLIWLVLASGITNAAFNWGVMIGEVVRVVLLFYLMPVWALPLARWLLHEPITPMAISRVVLAMSGAAIVLWQPEAGLPLPSSLADWLGLVGGASFALVNVMVRRSREVPDEGRALAMFVGGSTVALLMAYVLATTATIDSPPAPAWPWLLGNVALALALLAGNFALQYGAARLPATITAVVMLSEVVFATLSSIGLAGETLSLRTVIGGLLILGATLLARPPGDKRPASMQDELPGRC